MRKPKSKKFRIEKRQFEVKEIELLQSWIESGKPESGSNPLSLPPLSSKEPIGRIDDNAYSRYAGCQKFSQLPLSKKTKDGLRAAGYTKMSEIQRASLPHSLCGRDILGAAKTGSGKTLAFIIPALETLYKARWGPEDGVGCIIMSPTRELADQLFKELKSVGRHHSLVMGLLIGGSKDVDVEKERVNGINILVCTPGRLLQHMDETPYFDCSQLQVLVLDEADRILDVGFKKEVNAIISQLPKHRQTLLFSATQTKSVQDLARLSLKDPEYLSVHEESVTATPSGLIETGLVVPLDQKMDMLWSFIKTHLNSKILVFLSTCKQVKFVFEAFKKLRPGVPLKCLHGRMKQEKREFIFKQFCGETRVVLFATDVMSRGINFKDDNSKKGIDWVVQMDCPEDDKAYLHRVGRTARYFSTGKAVLFLVPSEMKMVEKLREKKIFIKFHKANPQKLQPVAGLLAALLVKYPNLQSLAQRVFVTYLRSIHKLRDKEVFDVTKLPIVEFSASLGLPMTPKLRFLKQRLNGQTTSEESSLLQNPKGTPAVIDRFEEEEEEAEKGFLSTREIQQEGEEKPTGMGDAMPGTRVLKKKKLKINVHRPIGSRVVFDEEGNAMPPLARLADTRSGSDLVSLDKEKVNQRYIELRDSLKMVDKEDKLADRQRRKEKRLKEKLKRKKINNEEEDNEEEEEEEDEGRTKLNKKSKIYFDNDSDEDDDKRRKSGGLNADSISLAEQEELALKLLSSMHS